MYNVTISVLLFTLLTSNVFADRNRNREEPQQNGKSFFFLGGLFRKIRTRWQHPPPSPYGGGPLFTGYYGCAFYNCQQPQQYQLLQPLPPPQPVQPIQTVVQTPIVVQQSQVYQPNAYAQAVAQQQLPPPAQAPPPPPPAPPQQQLPAAPPQQQVQYPPQAYGNPQPYPAYPVYPTAYASASAPGQVYPNNGCTYPAFLCGRRG